MDRTLAVIGCSPDPNYSFLLIFSALLWRRIGHEPLAIIVGRNRQDVLGAVGGALEWAIDPKARVALEALRYHRIPTYSMAAVDGYPYATAAQTARQCAAALTEVGDFHAEPPVRLQIADDDWIMPADADLFPFRAELYKHHEGSQHRLVSVYWNGDNFLTKDKFLAATAAGKRSQTLPTCHITMRVRDWCAIYNLTASENLADAVERTLNEWYAKFPRDGFNIWMSDQDIMTYKVCSQPWFPAGRPPDDGEAHASGEVLFVGRRGQPPRDRLDRSHLADWDQPFDPERWTDAHVLREPWTDDNWRRIRPIIAAYLPEHLEWADQYQTEFAR